MMRFYTTERLSENREFTPEGFLLCRDVPIARTGMMIYGPDEIPVKGKDGANVRIWRYPEDVFRPETIASFNGKPVTNGHPDTPEGVTSDNYRELSVGVVLDVRRGKGDMQDCLLADLLVQDQEAITDVIDGKREVSAGYDTDYLETGDNEGRQVNIIGNHVALVESGRCGPRCRINDHDTLKEKPMAKTAWERLVDFVKGGGKDEKTLDALFIEAKHEASAGATPVTHVHVHTTDKAKDEGEEPEEKRLSKDEEYENRFKKIEDSLEEINKSVKSLTKDRKAKDEDEPDKKDKVEDEDEPDKKIEGDEDLENEEGVVEGMTKDSANLEAEFQETVADAEVIAPGIRIPTFDAKSPRKKTRDSICGLRRKALSLGAKDEDTLGLIIDANGGKSVGLKNMTCDAVTVLFNQVAARKRELNSADVAGGEMLVGTGGGLGVRSDIKTPADLNKRLHEIYGG